jgi:glutaredoxin
MYTVEGCPTCEKAKHDLNRQGIIFEERDVYLNEEWLAEAEKLSPNRTVPVIITDGKVAVGFRGKEG